MVEPARREKEEAAEEEMEEGEGLEGRMAGRKEWLLGCSRRCGDCPSQWKGKARGRQRGEVQRGDTGTDEGEKWKTQSNKKWEEGQPNQ